MTTAFHLSPLQLAQLALRVVLPVTESRAMLPHMAAVCEAANQYIASGAAYRHNAYAAIDRAKRKKLCERNTD